MRTRGPKSGGVGRKGVGISHRGGERIRRGTACHQPINDGYTPVIKQTNGGCGLALSQNYG